MKLNLVENQDDRSYVMKSEIHGAINLVELLERYGKIMDYMTESMVASFYQVGNGCIMEYGNKYAEELSRYGYKVLRDKELKELKGNKELTCTLNISKYTSQVRLYPIKAVVVIGMILTESKIAEQLRQDIMDKLFNQQTMQISEKQMLQLKILNGDDMERILALKEYEGVITKPLIDTIEKQSDAINELKPHAEYAERVLEDKKTLLTPTQIAKDFGMAGKALNALLHDLGVQYKQNGQWLLYAKYQGKGYTGPYQPDIPNAKPQTRWTQAGKKFIHDILRKNGYKTILENQQEQQRFDFN